MSGDAVSASDDRLAAAVGYVCGRLGDLRAQLEECGQAERLDRFLAAVHGDGDVIAALDALHQALQAGGDPLGVYGTTGRGSVGPIPAGIQDARPVEALYLCPNRRCTRFRWPDPAASAPPWCAIADEPMLWKRL